jgi:hypothetical protein
MAKRKTAAESMDQTMGWISVIQNSPSSEKPKVARNYALAYALRAAFDKYLASPQFKDG